MPDLFSESGLSLERLRVICEVIECGTIAKAVEGKSVKASHYSRQIKEIEDYFGRKLFIRRSNRLFPTPEATRLATITRSFLNQLQDFRQELDGDALTIHLGAQESVIKWILIPHLAVWQKKFPGIKFDIQNHRTPRMIKGLVDAELDLAIIREEAVTGELAHKPFCQLTYGLFIPKILGRKIPKRPSFEILRGLPLATLSHHGRFSSHLNDLQDELGEELNVQATCNSFSLVVEVMKVDVAAAILPLAAQTDLPMDSFDVIQPHFLSVFARTLVIAQLRNENLVRSSARKVAQMMSSTHCG